jgi:hypothetical protein
MAPASRIGSVLVAALLLSAGCLSPGSPTEDAASTLSETPTTTAPATSQTPTTTACGWSCLDDRPDPDHAVRLHNDWNQRVTVHVRVVRNATNATVHDATYTLAPGTERTAYNVARADPDGVEQFEVVVTALNTTERTEVRTSECFGSAFARIRSDGSLFVSHSIC